MGHQIVMSNLFSKKMKRYFVVINTLFMALMILGSFFLQTKYASADKIINNFVDSLRYSIEYKGLTFLNENIIHKNKETDSIPILLYHGIVNDPDSFNVLKSDFKDQMFALKRAGWETISIYDYYDFIQGKKPLPEKSFLLTFDDGRKDSYYPADPILKALDYKAVMFVITGRSENQSFHLNWEELERMHKSGRWELQSHGKNDHDLHELIPGGEKKYHFLSNRLFNYYWNRPETESEYKIRIYEDLSVAKKELEGKFGLPVISYAYPFSDHGQHSENVARAKEIISETVGSLYPISFYQVSSDNFSFYNYPNDNIFMSKRIDVLPNWSGSDLVSILDSGKEKLLSYHDDFSFDAGWRREWGNKSLEDNKLLISSDGSTNGATALLDGTYTWKDYLFDASVLWSKGSNFLLLARYRDPDNYTACNFGPNMVRLEQKVNGVKTVLLESAHGLDKTSGDLLLGVEANKDVIKCRIGGNGTVEAKITDSNGGIGFQIWDAEPANGIVIIKEVNASALNN